MGDLELLASVSSLLNLIHDVDVGVNPCLAQRAGELVVALACTENTSPVARDGVCSSAGRSFVQASHEGTDALTRSDVFAV